MSPTLQTTPLADDELERLAELLDQRGEEAMGLEELDGFLAALVCGPELVTPREYLPVLWGEGVPFADVAHASEILGLVLRQSNTIAATLSGDVEPDAVYLPILFEDEHGVTPANDWAIGFMRGVDMRPGAWGPLFDSKEAGGAIVPMMMLAHEHHQDAEWRPKPISADQRESIIAHMIGGTRQIYRFFEGERASHAAAVPAAGRVEAKVGRNEACPCGSGKKFKFCCGGAPTTVH